MKTNYSVMFNGAIAALLVLLIVSIPYKGESMLTRLIRAGGVLRG